MIHLYPETGPGHVAKWDAKAEKFIDDDASDQMIIREERDPWS